MHRSNLPNVNGNLVITPCPPNVSRSWCSREVQVRREERLARSVGDRGQEKRVLEWCKKNVNMVRKLPKLDSAILTARGIDVDKFMTFVEEAPLVKKGPRAKPYDAVKERNPEKVAKTNYCQYCQRELPSTKHRTRRRPVFFTSPYECEYCGASNDIVNTVVDTDDNVSSLDSESCTSSVETVHDTIRRGNPARVIDHRTFHEKTAKSAKVTEELDLARNEEMDIFWRDDASEYFENVDNIEDQMSNLSLQHMEQSVFLTEASVSPTNIRPSQTKIAWDNEDSTQFAEINRTIATDDGLHKKDFLRSEDVQSFERHSDKANMRSGDFIKKIRISSRTHEHQNESLSGESLHEEKQKGALEVTKDDRECNINVNQENNSFRNATICSPVANRSVALSRLALMRLRRANRLSSKSSSSPGTRQRVTKEDPQTHSCDSAQSYSFLDAVSPEIKSIHEHEEHEKEDEETK